jgi:SPW repeat-containing protein
MFKALKWEDWVGVGLGMWLLASPWAFGFSDQEAATMNALVMGTILVLEEMLELGVHEMAEEWIDLVAGFWLIVSPFVLGFASHAAAFANTVAVGLFTVLFAAWALSPLDEKFGHWWHDHVTGH